MKIYFAGSIRGGRDDKDLYLEMIKLLKKYGDVLTEHVGDKNISALGEQDKDNNYIYERDLSWIKEADVVVAEVTTPSLGVGYEIAKADKEKPVLCLFRNREDNSLSAMISGNKNIELEEYTNIKDLNQIFYSFFNSF